MLLLLLLLLLHSNRQENDRQEGMHGHGRTASVLGARRYLPRVPLAATLPRYVCPRTVSRSRPATSSSSATTCYDVAGCNSRQPRRRRRGAR
uniref:Putative secreted peptide n=1 Tax=Anopheles braziliensis TaxID=58242 RepID=A0A2M3ZUQ7_9DIPT